jgi:transcriptional activator of cad operon
MRYFSVRQFTIDTQLPQLMSDGTEITIEPKLHQLLLYFCRQPNTIISRDQIIEDINQGIVVSDNAVNKMVANLRQLLGDNPKQPQFIKTIPKQGYCFIAPVEQCETLNQPQAESPAATKQTSTTIRLAFTALFCTVLVLIGLLLTGNDKPTNYNDEQTTLLMPLTRHWGVEFSPAISPDQRYLAYSRNDPANKVYQIWLSDLQNNKPEQMLAAFTDATELAWSPNSDKLVYTDYLDGVCQFNLVHINAQKSNRIESIADCNAGYIAQIVFSEDNNTIYYTARIRGLTPIQIFSMNLTTKTRQLINQPALVGNGNYSIDLSPDGTKMLILSSGDDNITNLHVLDRQTNQLAHKGNWGQFLVRAIWHHDNQSIVHTSNTLAHDLIQSDIAGNKMHTLVNTLNRVAHNYGRHPNKKDFYFTSFMMNNDNLLVDLATNQQQSNFNSAVYDKTPTFGASKNDWYFISKRNGVSQIFSASEKDEATLQVSNFTTELSPNQLETSPNNEQLLWVGSNRVTIMSLLESSSRAIKTNDGLVLAAHWLSDTEMAFSQLINDQRVLFIYDLSTQTMAQIDSKWQAAFASPSGKRRFYIESATRAVYEFDQQDKTFSDTQVRLPEVYGSSGLSVKATEQALVYTTQTNERYKLTRVNLLTKAEKELGEWLYMAGFDVLDESLLVSYEHSRSGDIVVTRF